MNIPSCDCIRWIYVPAFDERHDVRVGWFAERLGGLPEARADDRFRA